MKRLSLFPDEISKPATQNFKCGTTCRCLPLHIAIMRKPTKQVLLALASANPDTLRTRDSCGRIPLHYATRFGASLEVVNLLISLYPQGAAVTSDDGALPLMLACLYGDSLEVLNAVIDAYPNALDKRDDSGMSCSEYASDNPRPIASQFMALILERRTSLITNRGHEGTPGLTHVGMLNLSLQPHGGSVEERATRNNESGRKPCVEATKGSTKLDNSTARPTEAKQLKSPTKLCVICLDKEVSQVLVPCGHTCLCNDCGDLRGLLRIDLKCPECRCDIQQAVKVFGRIVND